jgi:hypothetical protein
VQKIDMEMNDVEIRGSASDLIEHHQGAGGVVANTGKPESLRSHW